MKYYEIRATAAMHHRKPHQSIGHINRGSMVRFSMQAAIYLGDPLLIASICRMKKPIIINLTNVPENQE